MGMFDHFPYTNFHELNLDWILQALKEIEKTMDQFVAINSLKYADPIQWSIVRQYEKNTIVIDPLTGTAYISVQAVPLGVAIANEDYWTVVFDLEMFVVRAARNFTNRYEVETTTTATFSTPAGSWLVWGDTLYVANVNITAGDSYVVDSNITHITMEEVKNAVYQLINNNYDAIINIIGSLDDLDTTEKSNLVGAINEIVEIVSKIGDLADLETEDKSNIVNAINEVANNVNKNKTHIAISELPDLLPATIQAAVNKYHEIDFDVDLDLGSACIRVPSNTEIYSSNGSTITGSSIVFSIVGQLSDTYDAALTYTDLISGSFVGNIEEGKEYCIKSDTNCVGSGARSLGYPNYMGPGTVNSQYAYPTIYTMLTVNSNNFTAAIPTYGRFTTGKAYKYNAISGVYIHDININSSANTNAYLYDGVPFFMKYCENCTIKNVNIEVGYGMCFVIVSCHDCELDGCQAVALDSNFIEHYHNNVYMLAGCYNVTIRNSSGVGSQPFDISYRNEEEACSAYCTIDNCTAQANYTCATTHPGTWACLISKLKGTCYGSGTDGIMLRGSMHTVKDCDLLGTDTTSGYALGSIAGCSTHTYINNVAKHFQNAFYLNEMDNYPMLSGGNGFINVNDNMFIDCQFLARLHFENSDPTTVNVALIMNNNTMRGNSSIGINGLIRVTGTTTATREHFIITGTKIINRVVNPVLLIDGPMTVRYISLELLVSYSARVNPAYKTDNGILYFGFLSVRKGRILDETIDGTAMNGFTEIVS